jgi:predicted SnoaL-like aldol condensation-catalyzing enzyme
MKKNLIPMACFAICLMSCNNESKPVVAADTTTAGSTISAKAQKNLDAMHTVTKAFETGDVNSIDTVIASNFVDHTDKGDKKGVDSLKAMIKMSHEADKTMKMEVVKELADDDYAFSLMHYSGTGDGKMMPAGPYDMHSLEVVRFSDGKAVEHWAYMEMSEVSKMMASMSGMDKMKAPDTGKKK